MNTRRLAIPVLISAVALGGCVYSEPTTTVPSASPPTAVVVAPNERVVAYPEGRYELRGDGTSMSPYYWVWVPAGATPPNPPPLPRRPQTQ